MRYEISQPVTYQVYGELRYCDCLDKMDYLIKTLSIRLESIDLSPVYHRDQRIQIRIEQLWCTNNFTDILTIKINI